MKTLKNKHSLHGRMHYVISALVLAIGLAATACSNNSSGPDDSDPVPAGSYPLVKVEAITSLNGGGAGIPVTFTDGGGNELTFHEGSLELQEDNRYDLSLSLQLNSANTPIGFEGTYVQSGNTLTFTDDDDANDNFTASVDEERLVAQLPTIAGVKFRLYFEIN